MSDQQEVKLRLVSSANGFLDFDVEGCKEGVHRICVGVGIEGGDICNVYGPGSSKRGTPYKGSAEATLSEFLVA